MKKMILFLGLVLSMVSCEKLVFEHPQPRYWPSVPAFPKSLQGNYPIMEEEDAVVVTRKQVSIKGDKTYTLGEDLILKRYRGYWIISLENKKRGAWDVYSFSDKGTISSLLVEKGNWTKLNEEFGRELIEVGPDGKALPLNIKRREFRRLLEHHFKGVE